MTAVTDTPTQAAPGRYGAPAAPADRGTLTVSDRVVERVAGYAVTLVDSAAAAPRRILGVTLGEAEDDDEARVRAQVAGDTATVQATIAVGWPASIRQIAEQARQRIRDDVQRITDVRVDHIDINVVSLTVPGAHRPRVR
ncbi:Asp23/Gls24 family envelope stress response protein [Cellulomonas fimi]|uniref:Asp23/Gls24 family envelope stress response protein n=1 Tax=Cellulomonas fimi TaxID=1708 RepID=A0A7Y0LY45_CELFI|nr:Asp23/Gls24 family envelope stress response protein [Cellulomonas fimi]NMR20079.1 Asp23/Gls24 family envelope stress response protein [Cellulomonas fimi]